MADDEYTGGVRQQMEDWVERLHQDGKRKRLRFHTVQNPIARAHTREKAHSRNMHHDVISQTNKITRETSAIWWSRRLTFLLERCNKSSATLGGTRP